MAQLDGKQAADSVVSTQLLEPPRPYPQENRISYNILNTLFNDVLG